MSDDDSGDGEFNYRLYSSVVRSGDKLPVPEFFRDIVSIDSEASATFWGYNRELGYAFLSDSFLNSDPLEMVNNRSYDFEKGSRVTIPKPDSDFEEGVLGSERPEEGDVVYLYTDKRLTSPDTWTVIVLSRVQFWEMMSEESLRPIPDSMRRRYRKSLEKTGSDSEESSSGSMRGEDEYLQFRTGREELKEIATRLFPTPDDY